MTTSMRDLQERYDWQGPRDLPEHQCITLAVEGTPYKIEWTPAETVLWYVGKRIDQHNIVMTGSIQEILELLEEAL